MAPPRGKRTESDESLASDDEERGEDIEREGDSGSPLGPIPEIMRRAFAVGLSGFFLTEEAIRKALGDTLPREWMDFALQQSDRAREEFLERLGSEFSRILRDVDATALLTELLSKNTLEVKAEIRLRSADGDSPTQRFEFNIPKRGKSD